MAIFKCKMCGGALEIQDGSSVAVCSFCGTKQTIPKLDNDTRVNLYDRANHFRRNNDYDKAMSIYEQLLAADRTDAEAYWSILLCKYGIEYVEDPKTHKMMPTINRAQYTSIFADEDYKSALQYADGYQRDVYEAEAKEFDKIQKGILAISQKEDPFDIFICYKETDTYGRRTQDSVLAQDLYYQLKQEGFKVFFSRITLEDKLGVAYEPYIFAALNTSKIMVVIGTSKDNLNAVWVKNEWSRFLALTKKDSSKVLIPAYRDMDPYDLPEEFSHLQAQDMSKLGFMQDLIRGIKKIVGATKPQPTTVVVESTAQTATVTIEPLLKRAYLFLEDADWDSANSYAERVLDLEPECSEAYIVKLLAELHYKKSKTLSKHTVDLTTYPNYKRAVRFADADSRSALESYNVEVLKNVQLAAKQRVYVNALKKLSGATISEKELKKVIAELRSISGYKDVDVRISDLENRLEAYYQKKREEEEKARIKSEKRKVAKIVAWVVVCVLVVLAIVVPISIEHSAFVNLSDIYKLKLHDGELTIVGVKSNGKDLTELIIPEEIDGYPLTGIDSQAFYGCDNLTSITIPASVTTIENGAFLGCTNIVEATMPANAIEYVPKNNLSTVVISGGNTIGASAFEDCATLTSLTILDGVTTISDRSFYDCNSLTSVVIPDSVTTIGKESFASCISLTSVTFGENSKLTTIGADAFWSCTSLTSIVIPDSVTTIGSYAFFNCSKLTSVTIGNSVTSIGTHTFYGCSKLTSITIPDSVTTIGSYAFCNCSKLTSVTFKDPNGWYVSRSSNATNLTLTNASKNATYLKDTYYNYYWHKK